MNNTNITAQPITAQPITTQPTTTDLESLITNIYLHKLSLINQSIISTPIYNNQFETFMNNYNLTTNYKAKSDFLKYILIKINCLALNNIFKFDYKMFDSINYILDHNYDIFNIISKSDFKLIDFNRIMLEPFYNQLVSFNNNTSDIKYQSIDLTTIYPETNQEQKFCQKYLLLKYYKYIKRISTSCATLTDEIFFNIFDNYNTYIVLNLRKDNVDNQILNINLLRYNIYNPSDIEIEYDESIDMSYSVFFDLADLTMIYNKANSMFIYNQSATYMVKYTKINTFNIMIDMIIVYNDDQIMTNESFIEHINRVDKYISLLNIYVNALSKYKFIPTTEQITNPITVFDNYVQQFNMLIDKLKTYTDELKNNNISSNTNVYDYIRDINQLKNMIEQNIRIRIPSYISMSIKPDTLKIALSETNYNLLMNFIKLAFVYLNRYLYKIEDKIENISFVYKILKIENNNFFIGLYNKSNLNIGPYFYINYLDNKICLYSMYYTYKSPGINTFKTNYYNLTDLTDLIDLIGLADLTNLTMFDTELIYETKPEFENILTKTVYKAQNIYRYIEYNYSLDKLKTESYQTFQNIFDISYKMLFYDFKYNLFIFNMIIRNYDQDIITLHTTYWLLNILTTNQTETKLIAQISNSNYDLYNILPNILLSFWQIQTSNPLSDICILDLLNRYNEIDIINQINYHKEDDNCYYMIKNLYKKNIIEAMSFDYDITRYLSYEEFKNPKYIELINSLKTYIEQIKQQPLELKSDTYNTKDQNKIKIYEIDKYLRSGQITNIFYLSDIKPI